MQYLVNRRELTIEWGHCDPANMVLSNRYFEYADWSTSLLFKAALKMSKPELSGKYDADMPLVDVRGRIVRPSKVADVIEIASTIREFRRSSFDVMHQFFSRGELVAEVLETRVWVRFESSEPPKLTSKPIPAELIEQFRMTSRQ